MTAATSIGTSAGAGTEIRRVLVAARSRFLEERGLTPVGDVAFGWRDRSVGSIV